MFGQLSGVFMSSEDETKKVERAPCGRCMALRLFILGALTIVAVWQVAPDSLFIIAQVTPMQAAMCAVGALAFLAIAKTLFEWFETKNSE